MQSFIAGIILLMVSLVILVLTLTNHLPVGFEFLLLTGAFLSFVCAAILFGISIYGYSKQSRDREILSEIFEGSTSARLVTDIQDNTLFFNVTFEDMCFDVCGDHGKPNLDCIREMFARRGDRDVMERLEALIQNAMRGHEDAMEASTVTKSAEIKWYRLSAQPVAGWLGTVHWRLDDITERRSVDAVIRGEREKLVDFTDHAPVGFYAMDETGRFTFVNATLARWLGSDIDSLLNGGRLHAYLEKPPVDANPYDLKPAGGAKQVAEVKIKGPAGRVFEASINQSVVIESNNRVRVRGVVHDLTSEREMRKALKASEDRFLMFFEEAPLGIAMVNSDGTISDANHMLCTMLSCKADELEEKIFTDLVAEDTRDKIKKLLSVVKHKRITSDPVDVDLVPMHGDGGNVAVKLYASPLRGNNVAIRLFDRSEQKTLEAQVNQSQKMQAVGQLAGGVAHDFNNLLTAIIGFCDLLLLRHKAGDPSFNDIMQIKQNSNRAANLVRQLLAFSRQQQLNPKVLDITETLTELSHLIRRLIGVQIELDLVYASNLYEVKVDEGQLEQVLINLAVNARDAMDGKGSLEIKTENITLVKSKKVMNDSMPAGDWVAIHVKDTGTGIDRETLERIFEPFFTTKKIGEGTGLGLATVYGIVRQTGGYIDVDSVVGKGTTFSVYLPRHIKTDKDQEPEKTVKVDVAEQDLTGTATILLVEDEDAVRMFSARALSNKGYQVLEADCGEAAIEVMEEHGDTVDIIVTDVIMPEMDGPTMAQKVLETYPDMPVIFVSGYTEDRFKEEIGENAHFLPKPFTLQQLAAKVKEVLKNQK